MGRATMRAFKEYWEYAPCPPYMQQLPCLNLFRDCPFKMYCDMFL